MMHSTIETYMREALKLAELGRYSVAPNPMVGCLIVSQDQIIGRGHHLRAGGPHAEAHALAEAGAEAKGATVYLSLEPCCHHGRTPPCVAALIEAQVATVHIAMLDPNPLVAGRGVAALKAAGIEVTVGCLEVEAQKLNAIFCHYIQTRRPFVISKWAMSLDGKTITDARDSRQISNAESSLHTQQLRHQVEAILVGANTAIHDDPQLTVRGLDLIIKQPLRVVLSTAGSLPQHLKVMNGSLPGKTLVVSCEPLKVHNPNIESLVLPKNAKGQVSLPHLLDALGARDISSLLVEGGMQTHADFFSEGLVNKIQVYVGSNIIAQLPGKLSLQGQWSQLGSDLSFTANL